MSDFSQLGLSEPIVRALSALGYEAPTPIQEESIPILLEGRDLLAQAQTGTGKTAAFALPILTRVNLQSTLTQVIVLVPTRELAIQVAESFYHYSKYLPQFKVLAIYGGQAFSPQLRALKQGVQVVVGTPGRVMDHLRRGSLSLETIRTVILDEADEMLNMGFIEDIEWILEQIAEPHQTALFSATMAPNILKIAKRHLKEPAQVEIKAKTQDAVLIQQQFCIVPGNQKLDALSLFLELEHNDATLIFTRTKISAAEVALKLAARGLLAGAIHGDMRQEERERVVRQLKQGDLDIVVATEVAARGLDIDRVSLVINYDIPEDPDSYVHRIGRTGRAGREGSALLFVTPRETRMLRLIEKTVKSKMEEVKMPHSAQMQKFRQESFKKQLVTVMSEENLENHRALVHTLIEDMECEVIQLAAALAFIVQGNQSSSARALRAQKPEHREDARFERESKPRGARSGRLSFSDKPRRDKFDKPKGHSKDRFEADRARPERGRAKPSREFEDRELREGRGRSDRGHAKPSRPFEDKEFKERRDRPYKKRDVESDKSRDRAESRTGRGATGRAEAKPTESRTGRTARGRAEAKPMDKDGGFARRKSSPASKGRNRDVSHSRVAERPARAKPGKRKTK